VGERIPSNQVDAQIQNDAAELKDVQVLE